MKKMKKLMILVILVLSFGIVQRVQAVDVYDYTNATESGLWSDKFVWASGEVPTHPVFINGEHPEIVNAAVKIDYSAPYLPTGRDIWAGMYIRNYGLVRIVDGGSINVIKAHIGHNGSWPDWWQGGSTGLSILDISGDGSLESDNGIVGAISDFSAQINIVGTGLLKSSYPVYFIEGDTTINIYDSATVEVDDLDYTGMGGTGSAAINISDQAQLRVTTANYSVPEATTDIGVHLLGENLAVSTDGLYTVVTSDSLTAQNPWPIRDAIDPNGPAGNLTLQWDPPADAAAVSYDVYLGTDETMATYDYSSLAQPSTSFPVSATLDILTKHFWRIDVNTGSGTNTGQVWSFTTDTEGIYKRVRLWAPYPSGAFVPNDENMELKWYEVGGSDPGDSYNVWLGSDPDAMVLVSNQTETVYNPYLDPAVDTGVGSRKYWRVDKVAGGKVVSRGYLYVFFTRERRCLGVFGDTDDDCDADLADFGRMAANWLVGAWD